MKHQIILFTAFMVITSLIFAQTTKSLHDFKMSTLDGKEFGFSQLKGKKVLIVNVASLCGLTPQYKQLQELYEKFGGEKFIILGFPANNFGDQEPGSDHEIQTFCSTNYGITFPMFSKISVKGRDIHPLYQWLTTKAMNGVMDAEVTWNFQKFMIDENGKVVDFVKPKNDPWDEKIISWLKN